MNRTEMSDAYAKLYPKKPLLHPNCATICQLMKEQADLSCLMQRFAHDFAWHFNRRQKFSRTGHLLGLCHDESSEGRHHQTADYLGI